MTKAFAVFICLILFLGACDQKKDALELLMSNHNFVMDDGTSADGYYKNRLKFIKPYTSVKYVNDTIVATTLQEINSCGHSEGIIEVKSDTIHLLTKHTSWAKCASVQFCKYRYVILNPKRKQYKIVF